MSTPYLRFKPRLSRIAAKQLVVAFARYGNHYTGAQFSSEAAVKRGFAANGHDFDSLVEACRDPTHNVPFFENLIGSTWTVMGATVSRVNMATGEEDLKTEGPATYASSAYWSIFEKAAREIREAVQHINVMDFHSGVVHGIASIEAFLTEKTLLWNKANPNTALRDSVTNKVSFDEKIDQWIPTMLGGHRLDKSGEHWRHFRLLRQIRDDLAIHPKVTGFGVPYNQLAHDINMFRTGIAGLLLDLIILFGDRAPREVIRAAYAPDVEVAEPSDESPAAV